ncbi:MAG TPA: undecaprenyldiphospho-muramoylpentapeptide beta-N-acetylglucosaminyltransferase [Xanthomonadales bacterium]|nr:undecaprenyldiphospho-muramoylpentapeptide beta-N-acetylglucosaminyltransferase [Xanthomonadales bacterium]
MNAGPNMTPQRVMILAGGTGGHIFPGLAVAASLRERGVSVHWLGAQGGMECQKVPAANIPIDTVNISGLRGKGLKRWLMLPWTLLNAIWQARAVIRRQQPNCAVSFGGYAAGPGGLAARFSGVPLVIHEQNRIPGLTNKVLARFSKHVLQAFPGTWPAQFNAVTCGNPVRSELVAILPPEQRLSGRQGKLRLLITGGSQGARALNEFLPAAIARLPASMAVEVRHQAGKGRVAETAQAYEQAGITADVVEFIDDMAAAYSWADLVVCRSGALTVSELAAVGLPAILVPFPHAVDDHQTRNAELLVNAGAARLQDEASCSIDSMAGHLAELLSDRAALMNMAQAARSLAVPDSAERVADICLRSMAA